MSVDVAGEAGPGGVWECVLKVDLIAGLFDFIFFLLFYCFLLCILNFILMFVK